MTWRDRDEYSDNPADRYGRPGGDWRNLRPSLDNPMTWAVPFARILRIDIRIHAVFLLWIVIELARSLGPADKDATSPLGFGLAAIFVGALFTVVLLHELGHCLACRRTGGTADEILMWPLGGLAYCQPPNTWRANMVTVVGGPLVNVIICLVLAPVLFVLTGRMLGVAIPNPLGFSLFDVALRDGTQPWWLLILYALQFVSLLLLLFNLLPMFPLDGGRIVQCALWSRMGYVKSMRISVRVGYFGAIALVLFGAITSHWMLIGIACFGGITCWLTHKQLEFTQDMLGFEDDTYAQSLMLGDAEEDAEPEPAVSKREAKKQAEAEELEAEVDRLLAKIAAQGMDSLTGREKKLLKQASDRRRQGV
jgi:stage IV sporulation protein FB